MSVPVYVRGDLAAAAPALIERALRGGGWAVLLVYDGPGSANVHMLGQGIGAGLWRAVLLGLAAEAEEEAPDEPAGN